MMAMRNRAALLQLHHRVSAHDSGNFPGAAIFRIAVLPSAMPDLLRQVGAVTERNVSQSPGPRDNTPEHKTLERQRCIKQHSCASAGVVYVALLPQTYNADEHTNGVRTPKPEQK